MSRACIALLFALSMKMNSAYNLRSQLGEPSFLQQDQSHKESATGEAPIPDPTCKKGVMSPDMKACCSDECGSCGQHKLCNELGKYHEVTGKLADNCCKDRILKKAASCDTNHPPCVLSASYKETINKYVIDRPKRHALDDCNKAIPITRAMHATAIDKGEFFSNLYLNGRTKYEEAKEIATKVIGLCLDKKKESKQLEDDYSAKIASASAANKVADPLSGLSQVQQWKDARDNEGAEVKFYNMISDNAKDVSEVADKGMQNVKSLRSEVEKVKDVAPYLAKLNTLIDDATQVYADAQALWKQWSDSSKDYACSAPPAVSHAVSQCKNGNTKYSPKCMVTCDVGYDGNGTQNALRCNRQGKFGKELYGEWTGMAACVGRVCGIPPKISKAKNFIQEIRYPYAATYHCYEGFSTNRSVNGAKSFEVPCGATGSFKQDLSHVCKAISCGVAEPLKHTLNIAGEFKYTEVANYRCTEGYTVDGTPGGLKNFSTSCQASGRFSAGVGCHPVRCGPPPSYTKTQLETATKKDQFFGDSLNYNCLNGYTIDQKPSGPDHFALVCQEEGEFGLKDTEGNVPAPKCRPVSAGHAPKVAHGNFNPREMFYGESVLVTADTGYTTTGNATQGTSFTLTVTPEGTYAGLEKFIPVVCGEPPSVEKAKTSFSGAKASYGDVLNYDCEKGHSFDKTSSKASATFAIQCQADGSFSEVPGLGKCANIDDCADHTCGPFGGCVDHIMNYTCNCKEGYEQNWNSELKELLCGNIDDCGPEACGVGNCIDLVKGYKCECPTGYESIDEEAEGKVDHTCKAVTCDTPPEVDNAATTPVEAGTAKAYYSEKVVYQCDTGFTIDGTATGKTHFTIECQASKQFTARKVCQPIKCDTVPKVNFTSATKTSATYNESVRYNCDKGHTVDATAAGDRGFTVTCQLSGKFGEPQACKPISCGEPDELPNAMRPSGASVFEGSVKYACFHGFTLDGSREAATEFEVECQEDGKFTKSKQCLPKVCGEPPAEINVLFASVKDEGPVAYPHVTEVICRDGYTVGGDPSGMSTFVVHCTADGVFEQVDKRACQPVTCGAPPAMSNSTLLEIKTPTPSKPGLTRTVFHISPSTGIPDLNKIAPESHDDVDNIDLSDRRSAFPGLNLTQNFALRFSGGLMIKKAGAYQFELSSDDGSILYINGNKIVDNDGLHTFSSKTGAVLNLEEGPQALTVEYFQKGVRAGITLKWKGPDAGDQWQIVPKTSLQTKGGHLNYEEKAIYQCLPGFTAGGEFDAPTKLKVECLPNGQLSGPSADMQCRNVDDCEQHTCGPKGLCIDLVGSAPAYTCECDFGYEIQTSKNGEKHCGNKDDCQGKDCGVGVCKDLVGDYTCTCPSGFYIGTKAGQKTCIPVRCSAATPTLADGKMLSKHSGPVDFPSTLRYRCDAGYSIDGTVAESSRDFQAMCKADGQLFGMKSCQKISCGTPHVVPFTKVIVPSSPRKSIEYNDKAKYECFEGYTIGAKANGNTTFEVKCQDDGFLTDPEVCEPVKCGSAPSTPNSRPAISGAVSFGMHLMYRCDMGYTLDGSLQGRSAFERTCFKNASFSALPSNEPCKPISAGNAPNITNAVMAEYAGVTVSVFPVRVFYPQGLEYRCKPGYSTNGRPSGPTKISARVNSIGTFTPALPSECKLIALTIRGRVKNARNGRLLSGVKVTIAGTSISATTSFGFFTLRNVPAGTAKLVYEKSTYIKVEETLTITGDINSGGVADKSMSPSMASDQWRAVVKWGRTPSDLDTYAKWGWSKVFYGGTTQNANGITGKLEVDKTNGYGPETLYLSGVGRCHGGSSQCDIKYLINDYTGSASMLGKGETEVTLYTGTSVAGTYKIQDCPRSVTSDGNWWHVFTLDGKTNRVKWSCTSGPSTNLNQENNIASVPAAGKPSLRIRTSVK